MKLLLSLVLLGLVGFVFSYNPKNTLYASNSCHRSKLPSNAPILSQSATYIKDLLRQINYTNYVWINTYQYSVPMYYVSSTQATSVVTLTQSDPGLQAHMNVVPIPSTAEPASGSDSSMLIYQASTDSIWEFWQFSRAPSGSMTASWGGYMPNVSINPGFFKNPHPKYGTAATSIGLGGGVMAIADAQAGVFPYALRVSLQDHAHSIFVPPAMRTDGNGKSMIPEGTRFRLPATFNVSSISNTFARMIATALRDYGMITADTSGGVTLYAEDPSQYGTNPWPTIWGNEYPSNVLQHVPWNLLEVVDPIWQPWNRNNSWYQTGGSTGPKSWNQVATSSIYADALSSTWINYSWATVSFTVTSPVHSGTHSIKANFTGATGFYLHSTSAIDTSSYNALSFWVKGAGSTTDLIQQNCLSIIQLIKTDGTAIDGEVRFGSLFTYGTPTSWTHVYVLFSDMGWTTGTAIQGFWIQAQMSLSGYAVLYIDDLSIVKLNPVN